ncbi:MAG: hypothetical protein ACERKD_19800 [Prolixibacteraceae bacterium]
MKSIIIFTLLILSSWSIFAQKSSEIVQRGIVVKRQYDQNFSTGDKEAILDKEEFYDFRGEIIEMKEYTNEGKTIKNWMKYKYDEQANLIEELELNEKGEQISRITYKFEKGLRTERSEYDAKNRLTKTRKYEYGYRK